MVTFLSIGFCICVLLVNRSSCYIQGIAALSKSHSHTLTDSPHEYIDKFLELPSVNDTVSLVYVLSNEPYEPLLYAFVLVVDLRGIAAATVANNYQQDEVNPSLRSPFLLVEVAQNRL